MFVLKELTGVNDLSFVRGSTKEAPVLKELIGREGNEFGGEVLWMEEDLCKEELLLMKGFVLKELSFAERLHWGSWCVDDVDWEGRNN